MRFRRRSDQKTPLGLIREESQTEYLRAKHLDGWGERHLGIVGSKSCLNLLS